MKINKGEILKERPQIRGIITKLIIMRPKKPNSAMRKVAKLKISKLNKEILAYIPGEGNNLKIHSEVLIEGGKTRDLPGVKYKLIRGVLDFK